MKKPDASGRKSDVKRLMRRLDSTAHASAARDKRIIDRASKMLVRTNWDGTTARKMDARLTELRTKHTDGWMNFFTGSGVPGTDKRTGGRVYWQPLEEVICEQVYGGDKIARRLVEMLPDDAFRQWITMKGAEPDLLKKITKDMNDIKVRSRFKLGWIYARLYGGAGTLVNVDDGEKDLMKPMDLARVRGIKSLWTFGRYELEVLPADVEYDLDSPNFGMPNLYMLVPRNRTDQSIQMQRLVIKFHHSRIIRWDGAQLPRRIEITNRYWGDSVLAPFIDSLRDYKQSVHSIASILQDFNVWITKIKGLADAIGSGNEDKIQKRVHQMDLARSVLGSILLDAENEDAINLTRSITGLGDAMEEIKSDVGSSQDAPRTRMFNEKTPGKLGGEDDDDRKWYDYVKSKQEEYARPNLLRFFEIYGAALQNTGTPWPEDEFSFKFNSLWQQTDNEVATTRKLTAETDQIYLSEGVVSEQEVRDSRFGGDEYSQETTLVDPLAPGKPVEEDDGIDDDGTANPPDEDEAGKDSGADLESNRNPDDKRDPPSEAGTRGSGVSPEAQAELNGRGSIPGARQETEMNQGKPKKQDYVKNLYSTFKQDGATFFRVDGEPLRLVAIHVSKDLARTREDAIKVAKVYEKLGGFVHQETELEHRFRRTFKRLGPINMARFVVKRPNRGLKLMFGKTTA